MSDPDDEIIFITVTEDAPYEVICVGEVPATEGEPACIVIEEENPFAVISVGEQGPAGPPGSGVIGSAPSGENINVHFGVALVGGLLYNVDTTNLAHANKYVGIALQSSIAPDVVEFQQMGELYAAGMFVPGARYFLGNGGRLTTNSDEVAGATWKKSIGIAKDVNNLVIMLGPTVKL